MSSRRYRLITERNDMGEIISFEIQDDENRCTRLNEARAQAVTEAIAEILMSAQPRRSLAQDAPLMLDEHLGVHILLVLRAVKPLNRYQRIYDVAQGIARMSREEATYWHACARNKGGLPALRRLLTP